MRGLPPNDFREVKDERGKSPVVDEGEYGVGGLSAIDEAVLDFRRAFSGFLTGLMATLKGGCSKGGGVRGGS